MRRLPVLTRQDRSSQSTWSRSNPERTPSTERRTKRSKRGIGHADGHVDQLDRCLRGMSVGIVEQGVGQLSHRRRLLPCIAAWSRTLVGRRRRIDGDSGWAVVSRVMTPHPGKRMLRLS